MPKDLMMSTQNKIKASEPGTTQYDFILAYDAAEGGLPVRSHTVDHCRLPEIVSRNKLSPEQPFTVKQTPVFTNEKDVNPAHLTSERQ